MSQHRRGPHGQRTLRFESVEARRVLSAQAIELDVLAPSAGESALIFSSGLASGWTPLDGDTTLVTIDRLGESFLLNGFVTRGELTPDSTFGDFDSGAVVNGGIYSFDSGLGTDVLEFAFDDSFTPTIDPVPPPEPPKAPIGAVDRGVEYGFTTPVDNPANNDQAAAGVAEAEPVAESLPRVGAPPASGVRPLDRIAMSPTTLEPASHGEGLIDLTALLITRTERTPAAPELQAVATTSTPARDAAFAVESWVRALPRAAAGPQGPAGFKDGERSAQGDRVSPAEIAPLWIDPSVTEESAEDDPHVSSIDPIPASARVRDTVATTTPQPLERSAAYRFMATLVSLMTVGGLVRAVRDEPVRRAPQPKRRQKGG
ncbi:hypothetical protein MalM25_31090 [Planctomycetes bacterium MalM25]|nr:hypothetical protein MalM25_31090 [Planctomycetes bacterium MalM25]